jgi:hypothetical protein
MEDAQNKSPPSKAPFQCVICGRPAHKKTNTVYNPFFTRPEGQSLPEDVTKETWDYRGNMVVTKRFYQDPPSYGVNQPRFIWKVGVWDGETWELNYGIFCSQPCGMKFAIKAYRAGYRFSRSAA